MKNSNNKLFPQLKVIGEICSLEYVISDFKFIQ